MSRTLHALLPFLAFAAPASVQKQGQPPTDPLPIGRILVSGFNSDALHVYDATSGIPLGTVAPVPGAQSIVRGADNLLYVCAEETDSVLRIDPRTMTIVDAFVEDDPLTAEDETGGLDGPTAAVFGPDGALYVASFDDDSILRYDGQTGTFVDVFVSSGLGGLDGPDAGTCFGPDGLLYVPSFWNDSILRYDASGASLGDFVPSGLGSLAAPRDLAFHGQLVYVASSDNNRILRYDRAGNFVDIFASLPRPYSLDFHPFDGNLYAVSLTRNHVRVFDGETGAFLRRAMDNGAGGLSGATFVFLQW